MGLLGRLNPLSVEVCASQVATIVAYYDSIDVEHGNHFENEVLAQTACQSRVAKQKVYDVLDDVATHGLSRVNARSEQNGAFVFAALAYSQIVAAA